MELWFDKTGYFFHNQKTWVSTAWKIIGEALQRYRIKIFVYIDADKLAWNHKTISSEKTFYFTNDQCLKYNFPNEKHWIFTGFPFEKNHYDCKTTENSVVLLVQLSLI